MADNKTQIVITAKDETRAAIASAQSGLQSLSTAAAGIGLQLSALAGIGSVGGLALMAKDAINAADALGKLSQKVGVSVESLAALEYAGKLSDVSLESLGNGLKKLSINIAEAAGDGTSEAAQAFKAIGVSVVDASGKLRNADAVFSDIAESFADMEDGAGKTALAVQLGGRSFGDLIPMLNAGKEGLAGMREEAQLFGLSISGDAAKQAEAFNDNLTRLSEASRGVGVSVANTVLPTLSQLSEEFVTAAKEGGGFASMLGSGLKTTLETIAVVGANVVYVFKAIGSEIGGIAAQMAALARGDFQGFKFIGEAMKEEAAKARAELDKLEQRILNPQAVAGGEGGGKRAAPVVPGSGKGKKDEKLSPEDMAYGGYKGAYKDFTDAIKRAAANAEAAADAEVKIEEEKQKRIENILKETYDYKLAIHHKELQDAAAALDEGLINEEQWAEFAQVRIDAFNKVKDEGKDAFAELQQAIEGWGKASADAFVEFAFTGKASFADMVQSILKDMAKMVVYQNVTKPLANSISKGIEDSGGFGSFFSSILGSFGGGKANGGPVTPGNYYVVGENGPEILVPNMSGTVIPNGGGMSGGITSNVTVNMSTGSASADGDAGTARDLSRRIETAVRSVLMVEQRPGGLLA